MVISKPKIPYVHPIYMVLANPRYIYPFLPSRPDHFEIAKYRVLQVSEIFVTISGKV